MKTKNKRYKAEADWRKSLYVDVDKDLLSVMDLYKGLAKKYDGVDIIALLDKLPVIPSSLFNIGLNSLEAVSRYLIDSLDYNTEEIAVMLQREEKIILKAYESSKHKVSKEMMELAVDDAVIASEQEGMIDKKISVPVIIFSNRKLSMLENLVKYLKEVHDLRFSKIARIISRDQRTVWTVYNRACRKMLKAE